MGERGQKVRLGEKNSLRSWEGLFRVPAWRLSGQMPREGWVGLVYLCGERNCNKAGLQCSRTGVTTAVCMRVSMSEHVHMHVPECTQSPEQRCDLVRQHVTANNFSKMLLPHEQPGVFLTSGCGLQSERNSTGLPSTLTAESVIF